MFLIRAGSDIGVSPHTRGWTLPAESGTYARRGFPAHAGMDPRSSRSQAGARRFPRTRGDGPLPIGLRYISSTVSPHTRGWTHRVDFAGGRASGFPAHAGMDPCSCLSRTGSRGFPRTRGDGPDQVHLSIPGQTVSPHTRGWTLFLFLEEQVALGFPAHAGMDPPA